MDIPGVPKEVMAEHEAVVTALQADFAAGSLTQREFNLRADAEARRFAAVAAEYMSRSIDPSVDSLGQSLANLQALNGDDTWTLGDHCFECGRAPEKLSRCGKCKLVKYCSPECQRKAWAVHKKSCGSPLPTAATVRASAPAPLLATLREFGSSEHVLRAVSNALLSAPCAARARLVQGEAPWMVGQALRLCADAGRADRELWQDVIKALGIFVCGDEQGRATSWSEEAAAQISESGVIDAVVLNLLQLGSVQTRGPSECWTRTEHGERGEKLSADFIFDAGVNFLAIVSVADPPVGTAIRQRIFDLGGTPLFRAALEADTLLNADPAYLQRIAAKALHAILSHDRHAERSGPARLTELLRRTQLAPSDPAASQEGFVLLQCMGRTGAKAPHDLELFGYLRDLAVGYVCECAARIPGMVPSAMLLYKEIRDAARDSHSAECFALFEDVEARNPRLARFLQGFRIGGEPVA